MERWRLFKEKERLLSTAEGLSIDDTLSFSVSHLSSPPILHLYRFVPSAIVGRYQDIEAALRLDRCRERGVEYNRRSTGGGTVIMGPEVVALGLGINLENPALKGASMGKIFEIFAQVLSDALSAFGIEASFRPKNDLEVRGRKIAGLSAAAEDAKSILFHTSLIVDFDMELMQDIINTPLIKLSDKGYSCFSQRMTAVKWEAKSDVTIWDVMESIEESFKRYFNIKFKEENPTEEEVIKIQELIRERYTNKDWIFSKRHPRFRMGIGRVKTKGGLLEIYLSLSGASIQDIVITGDFFSTTRDINRLESTLKWTPAFKENIKKTIDSIWYKDMIYGIDPDILTEAILKAKESQVRL